MSELVVIKLANESDAKSTLNKLRAIEKQGQIKLEDTAVVSKSADGKVNVNNEWSSGTEVGAVVGGAIGLMTSFLFPVVGTVAGAAAGGWIGSKFREGIDKSFVEDVSKSIEPGKSALFLLVNQWNPAAVASALEEYEGSILQTTLAPDLVSEIERALR